MWEVQCYWCDINCTGAGKFLATHLPRHVQISCWHLKCYCMWHIQKYCSFKRLDQICTMAGGCLIRQTSHSMMYRYCHSTKMLQKRIVMSTCTVVTKSECIYIFPFRVVHVFFQSCTFSFQNYSYNVWGCINIMLKAQFVFLSQKWCKNSSLGVAKVF